MNKIKSNNTSDELLENKVLLDIIENKLIENEDKLVVGVSGGPDSMCLLNILVKFREILLKKYNIKYSIVVAHLNHGFRKESDDEKVYVEEMCEKYDVPFYYKKIDAALIAKEKRLSDETCAREERYMFFNEVLLKTTSNKIVTAHNLDDNVETILLNIIRGTGIKGLIGIEFEYGNIIRPLLSIKKQDILEYCSFKRLNPCFDITNTQDIYMRNKVRLNLIPMLKNEYNENIVQNIMRLSQIAKNTEEFLDDYVQKILKNSILSYNNNVLEFNFKDILEEKIAVKYEFIRGIINSFIGNLDGIELIHIKDIQRLLNNNITGKQYIIGNKFTIKIVKKNMAIIFKGGKNEKE